MKNPEIEKMSKSRIYEIARFPMHYSDEMVMNELRKSTNSSVIYYVAYMNGIIPIVTIGCYKSFVADFNKKIKRLSDSSNNSRS